MVQSKVLQSENPKQETRRTQHTAGVFTVFNSQGTSILDGAVNIGQTGNTSFINCKLLIDTGALVLREYCHFRRIFCSQMGGNTENYKL